MLDVIQKNVLLDKFRLNIELNMFCRVSCFMLQSSYSTISISFNELKHMYIHVAQCTPMQYDLANYQQHWVIFKLRISHDTRSDFMIGCDWPFAK